MRSSLLKSFMLVVGFWWGLFAIVWSLSDPETIAIGANRLQSVMPFIDLSMPESATIFNSWKWQAKILLYWSVPVICLSVISALVGALVVGWKGFAIHKERSARERGGGTWRGVGITLGDLPIPAPLKFDPIELDSDMPLVESLDTAQRAFLEKVIGILSANPESYCGEGHGVSILEHTVNRLDKLIERDNVPALAILVSACADLGKITAYSKDGDRWEKRRDIDRESARIVGSLDEWWALPEDDRFVIQVAAQYGASPKLIPDYDGNDTIKRKVWKLLDFGKVAEQKATAEEKQKVLEAHELPELTVAGFLNVLADMPFQAPGLAKNIKAAGWKKKGRLYLLEIQVRERTMLKIDRDVASALGGAYREKSKTAPFTNELLKGLDKKGWLVKEVGDIRVKPRDALWKIKAGTHEFKGVMIIDIKPEFADKLPSQDTLYEIEVVGQQFGAIPPAGDESRKPSPRPEHSKKDRPAPRPQVAEAPRDGGMASIAGLDLSDVLTGSVANVGKKPEPAEGLVPEIKEKKDKGNSAVLGDLLG